MRNVCNSHYYTQYHQNYYHCRKECIYYILPLRATTTALQMPPKKRKKGEATAIGTKSHKKNPAGKPQENPAEKPQEKPTAFDQAGSIILKPCKVRNVDDLQDEMKASVLITKYGLRNSTTGELIGFRLENADLHRLGLPLMLKDYESMDGDDWTTVLGTPEAERVYVPQPLVRSVVVDDLFQTKFTESGTLHTLLTIFVLCSS